MDKGKSSWQVRLSSPTIHAHRFWCRGTIDGRVCKKKHNHWHPFLDGSGLLIFTIRPLKSFKNRDTMSRQTFGHSESRVLKWHKGNRPTIICIQCGQAFVWKSNPTLQAIFMIPSKPPPTLETPTDFSPELNAFIQKCCTKDPSKRPSAVELLNVCFTIIAHHKDPFVMRSRGTSVLVELVNEVLDLISDNPLDQVGFKKTDA